MSQQYIKIGLLATLLGPFKVMGEEGVRGATLALAEFGHEVGGVPVELVVEGTNAVPQTAVDSAYLLFARKNIDFLVGPLSGNEGLAIRDYAKTVPDRVFINGTAASQDITLRNPADNFFSFSMHGVQWMAGLGTYAYGKLGYRRVVTIGEDYSYPHAQVAGFMLEFCRAGGEIINKVWLPLGTTDFRPFLLALEGEIDAIFVALAGRDAVNFLEQYAQVPLIQRSWVAKRTSRNTSSEWLRQVQQQPAILLQNGKNLSRLIVPNFPTGWHGPRQLATDIMSI